MATEAEIRDRLASYLAGEIELDSFDEWLTGATWNVHQSGDDGAQELTYAIELVLSEHSAGHMTDQRLRERLSELLRRYSASIVINDPGAEIVVQTTATQSQAFALAA
jgi:hypothetical protein